MQITHLHVKNFRCLQQYDVDLSAPIVLISGNNGAGKTTILEALHYACYLRSFRTHLPKELIAFEQDNFFINVHFRSFEHDISMDNEINVGFADKKRLVKINEHAIQTYKELADHYRIVTITDSDMMLIKGGPDIRRSFIDQGLALLYPSYTQNMRTYKQILLNRNALLQNHKIDQESYDLWTERLWHNAHGVIQKRKDLLITIQKTTNSLLKEYFNDAFSIQVHYKEKKKSNAIYDEFSSSYPQLQQQEIVMGRTLFGPHLDDISIIFHQRTSKAYASRGQQKLTVLLLKVALLLELQKQKGPVVFLLDDIMADFDPTMLDKILNLLTQLGVQLIFTSPAHTGHFEQKILEKGALQVKLTY